MGASYTSIVLGNHPVPLKQRGIFLLRLREGVTKQKLKMILVLPFRKQRSYISQVGFVRLATIRLEAPVLDFLLLKPAFKKARTTVIAFGLN